MSNPPLHPDLLPLAALLGVWSGEGQGSYPTIEPFGYVEEIRFDHIGKPFLAYSQKTRHATQGRPLHAETGYWRVGADQGQLEVLLAHPTGIVEVLTGTIAGGVFDLRSHVVASSPTAKSVTQTARRFQLVGDELRYTVAMAAVGEPLTHHLRAALRRSE